MRKRVIVSCPLSKFLATLLVQTCFLVSFKILINFGCVKRLFSSIKFFAEKILEFKNLNLETM